MKSWQLLVTCTLALAGCEENRTEKGQELAARNLFDPGSAEFRDVVRKGSFVCGQVNGKNRMGAYVGFSGFVANVDTGQVQHEPAALSDLEMLGLGPSDARMAQLDRDLAQLSFSNNSAQNCGAVVSVDRTIIDEVRRSGTIRGRDWK